MECGGLERGGKECVCVSKSVFYLFRDVERQNQNVAGSRQGRLLTLAGRSRKSRHFCFSIFLSIYPLTRSEKTGSPPVQTRPSMQACHLQVLVPATSGRASPRESTTRRCRPGRQPRTSSLGRQPRTSSLGRQPRTSSLGRQPRTSSLGRQPRTSTQEQHSNPSWTRAAARCASTVKPDAGPVALDRGIHTRNRNDSRRTVLRSSG